MLNKSILTRRLGLQQKFLVSAFIIIIAFLASFTIITNIFISHNKLWKSFENGPLNSLENLYDIHKNIGFNCGIHAFKNYFIRKDIKYYNRSKSCFESALISSNNIAGHEISNQIIQKNITLYLSKLEELKNLIKENKYTMDEIDKMIKVDDAPADKALTQIATQTLRSIQSQRQHINQDSKKALTYAVVALFFSLVLLALILYLTTNRWVKEIITLKNHTTEIAKGNFDTNIKVNSDDEIGMLANSLKTMQNTLRSTMSDLKESNRDLEEFAYVASHDLQEPVRKIISFGERLSIMSKADLDDSNKAYLDKIISSSLRMRSLIDDLLNYSRVSRKSLSLSTINLNKVIDNVIEDLELTIKKTEAKIEVDEIPEIKGDGVEIRQLFYNLISNSLKFHKQSLKPVIKISSQYNPSLGVVTITLTDNGIGFDNKFSNKILIPFQRLHTRDEYEGTGIGLSICNKIVLRHGSTLNINSKPGEGSSFSFNLQTNDKGNFYAAKR